MRLHRQALFVFALAVALLVPLPAGAQSARSPVAAAGVSGIVVDQRSGLAFARASVALERANERVATTETISDGRYTFAQIAAGIYRLEIMAEG